MLLPYRYNHRLHGLRCYGHRIDDLGFALDLGHVLYPYTFYILGTRVIELMILSLVSILDKRMPWLRYGNGCEVPRIEF